MKKFVLGILALVGIGIACFFLFVPGIAAKKLNRVEAHAPYEISAESQKLHNSLTVMDWHADSLLWQRDLLERDDKGLVDFPRLREGNVAVQMFTTVTKSPAGLNYEKNAENARDQITLLAFGQLWPVRTWQNLTERALYQSEKLHKFEARDPDNIKIIKTRADLLELLAKRSQGKMITGALIGAEGGHALSGKLENLDRLDAAGFRMIGLTHFFDNKLGGSLHGTSEKGLSDFGRQVVEAMEAKKIIIDLAHTSQQMAKEVLAMATRPVVVSHTGIYSHCETKRNFPDELMKQIADKGGLIAIGFWKDVTCDASPKGVAKTLIAAVNLLGEDRVALGSDYDGSVPFAFDASELASLTQELLNAGLTETTIGKIMGGNSIEFLKNNLP